VNSRTHGAKSNENLESNENMSTACVAEDRTPPKTVQIHCIVLQQRENLWRHKIERQAFQSTVTGVPGNIALG
jgi:hypothetical protein